MGFAATISTIVIKRVLFDMISPPFFPLEPNNRGCGARLMRLGSIFLPLRAHWAPLSRARRLGTSVKMTVFPGKKN
jgi:hypothetical protein